MKLSMKRMMLMTVGCGLALSGAGQVLAGSVTIPNSFTSGSAALASEVNANFTAVKSAVDDNDTRIAALEAQLSALQGSSLTVASMNGTYQYAQLEAGGNGGTNNYMVGRFGSLGGDMTFDGAGSCSVTDTTQNAYDQVWSPDTTANDGTFLATLTDQSLLETASCTYTLSASGGLTLTWSDGSTTAIQMSPDVQAGVATIFEYEDLGAGESSAIVSLLVLVKKSQ